MITVSGELPLALSPCTSLACPGRSTALAMPEWHRDWHHTHKVSEHKGVVTVTLTDSLGHSFRSSSSRSGVRMYLRVHPVIICYSLWS